MVEKVGYYSGKPGVWEGGRSVYSKSTGMNNIDTQFDLVFMTS